MALVLDKEDYRTFTRDAGLKTNQLTNPAPVNKEIASFSSPFESMILQETQNSNKATCKLQEVATNIGVDRIVDCIEEQYVEELNKKYLRFANSYIHTILAHHNCTPTSSMVQDNNERED